MSSKRIAVSCTAMALAIAAGSWYAVQAFPLQGAGAGRPVTVAARPGQVVVAAQVADGIGPLERTARPITPENPIPRRTHSVAVVRPAGAAPFVGAINLRLTLDASGRVAEVRGGNSLPTEAAPYIQAAIDAVRQWQYAPPADAPIAFNVAVAVPRSGDVVAVQAPSDPREVTRLFDPRPGARGTPGGAAGRVGASRPGVTALPSAPPAPGGPVRIGGAIGQPVKTRHVNPEYPAIAQSARVQGVVIVEAVIGDDGRVQDARILRSIPLLDQAALDAVGQWEFTPTLLNGQPVPVIMTVTVQFTLPAEPNQP